MIKTLSGVSLGSDLQPRGVWKTDSKTTATATQQRNVVASTLRTTAISEAAYAITLSRTTSDALFLALRRVKADLNADINTRLEQSARIIQRTPDEVLPALVLAATWFDNAARDADIIRRNAITHPGFVPVIPLKVPVQ
ncbi:Tail/DNA circulation protein [Escherichia coli]|nr:Tail/DNA circulation protein [Escherichia coli]